MFWSLILEPSKRYSSTVSDSFHLSMAALDMKTVKNDKDVFPVQLEVDNQELVLGNLSKNLCPQVNLDLVFSKGSSITFFTSGKATIHLTGFLTDDNFLSDEEHSEDESTDMEIPNLKGSQLKGKENSKTEGKNKLQSIKNNKVELPIKRKSETANDVAKKKAKPSLLNKETDDDDEDSQSDFDMKDLGLSHLGDDDDDESQDESGEDDDDDDDDSENDEVSGDSDYGDNDSDDEVDSDEDEVPKKPVQQTPKKKLQTEMKTKTPTKSAESKTPTNVKKDGKQNNLNKSLLNGTTPQKTPKGEEKSTAPQEEKSGKTPSKESQDSQKRVLTGGVIAEELKVGNGPVAKPGKLLVVYYTGRLKSNNRVFDQTNSGKGFKFRLGKGEVIKGWDVGFADMKVGSKRRLVCPPAMAYGQKGSPPEIPPNATLVFDVELKSVI